MTSPRIVTLADGRAVPLSTYLYAWYEIRTVCTVTPEKRYKGGPTADWTDDCRGQTAAEILRQFRAGMQDRINQEIPYLLRGMLPADCLPESSYMAQSRTWRKMQPEWQWAARRTAREVNTPRLRVRYVPREFRERLAHRIEREE